MWVVVIMSEQVDLHKYWILTPSEQISTLELEKRLQQQFPDRVRIDNRYSDCIPLYTDSEVMIRKIKKLPYVKDVTRADILVEAIADEIGPMLVKAVGDGIQKAFDNLK